MALFRFVIIQTYQYIKKKHNSINHSFTKGSVTLRRRKEDNGINKQHPIGLVLSANSLSVINQHNGKNHPKGINHNDSVISILKNTDNYIS